MYRHKPIWLRAVEGPETGGSAGSAQNTQDNSNDKSADTTNEDQQDQDQDQDQDVVDWEAKYHDMKKHSRDWERKARASAKELDRLRDEGTTDLDRVQARLADVEKELETSREENQRLRVATRYGLNEEDTKFLRGDEETMEELAKRLADRTVRRADTPENPNQGKGSSTTNSTQADISWANRLMGKNINSNDARS